MSKIWAAESYAMLTALFVIVLTGTLLGDWLLAISLTLGGYIVWLYLRLKKLEKWLRRGTKPSEVYDDDGFIGIIIRHLYQQKKVYNERKKRSKEMLGRLNRNISALPDATVLLNDQLEIEWCNAPAQYLLKIHPRHDLGQRIGNLIRYPEFLRYLNAPEEKDFLEIKAPGDNAITLQIKVVRFGDNQYLLTVRNISDQKMLQEGLKHFVANASHELKSPLTVIAGHLEMLEEESGLSAAGEQSIKILQNQSKRMHHLIDDLLLLSQVESYHLQPDEGDRLSVSEMMRNIMSALTEGSTAGRIDVKISDNFILLGVKHEIEGICINLIENALKYSNDPSPVTVSWSENSSGEYIFSVSDRGPGIGEQDLTCITERYYRGRHTTAEQITGSGLGLAIVQQAADKHGASLDISSQLGKGSTFSVTFPSYRSLNKEKELATVIRLADY